MNNLEADLIRAEELGKVAINYFKNSMLLSFSEYVKVFGEQSIIDDLPGLSRYDNLSISLFYETKETSKEELLKNNEKGFVDSVDETINFFLKTVPSFDQVCYFALYSIVNSHKLGMRTGFNNFKLMKHYGDYLEYYEKKIIKDSAKNIEKMINSLINDLESGLDENFKQLFGETSEDSISLEVSRIYKRFFSNF